MDICEYKDVICPVCKRDDGLQEISKPRNYPGYYMHIVVCKNCEVLIHLPCED